MFLRFHFQLLALGRTQLLKFEVVYILNQFAFLKHQLFFYLRRLSFVQEEVEEEESPINLFPSEIVKPAFHFTSEPAIQINPINDSFAAEIEDFELPANVAVLKQLISKLPSNVSKQTGAQIIKQTMEALGISMKSVLQEAQQVQENINASARECQNNISEYKRQISLLETQTQKLHRQYSMVNDIISLFIQAN